VPKVIDTLATPPAGLIAQWSKPPNILLHPDDDCLFAKAQQGLPSPSVGVTSRLHCYRLPEAESVVALAGPFVRDRRARQCVPNFASVAATTHST
jgi:hypothetical protein